MADIENDFSSTYSDWVPIFLAVLTIAFSSRGIFDFFAHFKHTELVLLILKLLFKTISGTLLSIVVLPVLLTVYILLLIFSTLNDLYVKMVISPNVHRASGLDTFCGLDSIESPPYASTICAVKGKPDLDSFRKHFTERVLNRISPSTGLIQFPKFKQVFCTYGGYCYWKDVDNFDIKNHIHLANLGEMYPELKSKKGIDMACRYLSEHGIKTICNKNMPQWEMSILQTGEEEFFYHIRIHHAIGDAGSWARLLTEYICDEPTVERDFFTPPRLHIRIIRTLWAIIYTPYGIGMILYKGRCNPLQGPKLNGKKHFVTAPELPFNLFREIKRRTKTPIPAAMFSAVTSAFGKHFQKSSAKMSWLTAIVPIGVSNVTAELKLHNTIVLGMYSLPVPAYQSLNGKCYQTHSSLANLFKMSHALRSDQQDPTSLSYFLLLTIFVNVIPTFLGKIIYNTGGVTVGLTNIPGPKKLVILKQELTDTRVFSTDRSPLGIIFSFVTSNGILQTSLRIDDALVGSREKAEELCTNWHAEIMNIARELDIKETS